MVEEVVCEVMEEVSLLGAEEATVDLVNSFLQFWVSFVVLLGIVPAIQGREGEERGGGQNYITRPMGHTMQTACCANVVVNQPKKNPELF